MMEPSKEAIAVRITRLNRQILGKVTCGVNKLNKRTIDRETLLDALTILYDECNDDPVKKCDELVKTFVDKYRSTLAELRRMRVCLSDFDILQCIGSGQFGEVHMVREKETGDVYAMKTLRKDQAHKRIATMAEDERNVLASANSPWIPRLQYAFQDSGHLYLVMELCLGGDLAGLLARRNQPLAERDAAFYVAEVAHALKALHAMGYVHRDVKPHNILLDRCGHVKLGDLGSCARLSEGGAAGLAPGTADYVAPELLAAVDCATRHTVCLEYCRGIVSAAITACDYWSLGVVAFELVTLRRPFSSGDDDSVAQVLSNIQRYERSPDAEPPFEPPPAAPSEEWRELVSGLLRVQPARRYAYLDTLRHPALAHTALHSIRDHAPPWVPLVRGPEDASQLAREGGRTARAPDPGPFRARPPFAGQLPFVGYSYIASDDTEESTGGFNASHDCTAIDLATFKSAEKIAAMRAREISSLQNKLAAAEAAATATASAAGERARREADAEAERTRAKLQAEITALSLQNRRLERQVEVEKEERMALQRTNQELTSGIAERNNAESIAAAAAAAELHAERDALRAELRQAEARAAELQAEVARALAAADTARLHQQHYKDTIAKERALRRQTLSGGEAESREAAARLAAADANLARETRAREQLEKRVAELDAINTTLQAENDALHSENVTLRAEIDRTRKELDDTKDSHLEKQRTADTTADQLRQVQQELTKERVHVATLLAQVQELEHNVEEATQRESALEEQCSRTEARFHERLEAAEARAATALHEDARHREKVSTLEQLVRRLEREVSALERRECPHCASVGPSAGREGRPPPADSQSDTESVGDGACAANAQLALLKEQLERAEAQLLARAEEIATLRQETRTANLARWRKEKECSELSLEAKSTARELKRVEERLSAALEARKTAEQKATALQSETATLRPECERVRKEAERLKIQLEKLQKTHETTQAEVDRSRNDIRKLKSELTYSEKRRMHAEEQEELSSRERTQMRDELHDLRTRTNDLEQNNKALQEACSILEEQLTDLEKLTDHHELKNKNLESEVQRVRAELESCQRRLAEAEREAAARGAAAGAAARQHDDAREQVRRLQQDLQIIQERLENRESLIAELEARCAELESAGAARDAALAAGMRRVRDLQEEAAALRTRAHQHHALALQLQAALDDKQEELCEAREAAEAATAWWRTRETKADATLRQQAKLIDFLQAKVEEAGRKKCSLSNKLFGRSGRRTPASPPLKRANRELREEVDRLRAKLAARASGGDAEYFSTPRTSKKTPQERMNGRKSKESADGNPEHSVQIVWSDGCRESMRARSTDGALVLRDGDRSLRAKLLATDTYRSFTIKFDEETSRGREAAVVCSNMAERDALMSRLQPAPAPTATFAGTLLCSLRARSEPTVALYLADNAFAIGCTDGLHSLRGRVRLELDGEGGDASAPSRCEGVCALAAAGTRALLALGDRDSPRLTHAGLLALGSATRRAAALRPALQLATVTLPAAPAALLLAAAVGEFGEAEPCAAVACGRRVYLLHFDASTTQFRVARSLTVDRSPGALLLTPRALYIAGEKPLKINLPSGALEAFAIDEPIIAAAARKHSPPKAILLVRNKPVEILLCYAECGVFVDENGKRTRNEDPKWSSAVHAWEYVHPFLYVVGEDRVTILYLTDEVYKSLPCTCDTTSLASTTSDCYLPKLFNLKLHEPKLLGKAPNGIIVRSKEDDKYNVTIIEGMDAFRSIGGSIESLETVSDSKRSSTDFTESMTDIAQPVIDVPPQDISQESLEGATGFLADIRKRAQQLRKKHRQEQTPDDVIKEILTTEVGLKRSSNGRKSPVTTSEFDSDSTENTEEERTSSTKGTADVCAEMFTRQMS